MPGLIRGMVRAAAVVGTATATRNAINRRQAEKNAQAYAHAMSTAEQANAPVQQYAPRRKRNMPRRLCPPRGGSDHAGSSVLALKAQES